MLIEMPLCEWNEDLVKKLPEEGICIIKPKHFDGMQIIQIFIDFAEIVTPAAITSISTYLVAMKTVPKITIKVDSDNRLEVEIKGRLDDKKITENLLYNKIIQLLEAQIEGNKNGKSNGGTIHKTKL